MRKQRSNIKGLIVIMSLITFVFGISNYNSALHSSEKSPLFKTVSISGSDYDIGFQRAKLYLDELKEWEGISERLFTSEYGAALKLAFEYHTTVIKEQFSKVFEEYQGMADGAEMKLEDIIIAHLGEETLWETAGLPVSETCAPVYPEEPGCSVFAMSMSDRGPIVGNTGDSSKPLKPGKVYYIEKLNYEDSYRIVRCKGAAVNEMGLAIGSGNAHYAGKTGKPNGDGPASALSIVTVRYCANTHSAVNFIRNYQVWDDGNHYAMADITGMAAAVEKGPPGVFNVRWAKSNGNFDKAVWVTNTPPDPEMRALWWWDNPKYVGPYMENSDDRYQNLVNLFTDPDFEYTFESAENVIFDHNPVGAVCQHGDVYVGQQYTTRTRMMLPAEGRLLLAARLDPLEEEWRPCVVGWAAQDTITIIKSEGHLLEKQIAEKDVFQELPRECVLAQNYPNPFNAGTTIPYELAEDSHIELRIFNLMGEEVITLKDELQSQGNHSVKWDGTNEFGITVASGVYYYQLKVGNRVYTKQMTLLQ